MSRSLRARGLKSNPLGNVRTRSAMSRSLRARGLKFISIKILILY